jgi:hypothetical protein
MKGWGSPDCAGLNLRNRRNLWMVSSSEFGLERGYGFQFFSPRYQVMLIE